MPPTFSKVEKLIGITSRPNSRPGYNMRIYHDYYPFYYSEIHYEVKENYSNGRILDTKFFKTMIQTLYVSARCGSVYKKSNWEEHFVNIVEI